MTRAIWKGPLISSNSLASRNIMVTPAIMKETLQIHNGKELTTITLNSSFLGKKLGALAPSKVSNKSNKTNLGTKRSAKVPAKP
jgi:ribosomal protein S19